MTLSLSPSPSSLFYSLVSTNRALSSRSLSRSVSLLLARSLVLDISLPAPDLPAASLALPTTTHVYLGSARRQYIRYLRLAAWLFHNLP